MSIINRNSGSPIYNTTAEAQAANLEIGQLPIVLGDSAALDRGGKIYTVVANGSGGLPMSNGNELLQYTGDGATYDATTSAADTTPNRLWRTDDLTKTTSSTDTTSGRVIRTDDFNIANANEYFSTEGRENYVINGDCAVSQQFGHVLTTNISANPFRAVDRIFVIRTGGVGAAVDVDTTEFIGDYRSVKVQPQSFLTNITGTNYLIPAITALEAQDVYHLNSQEVTLSFTVETNWTGNLSVAIKNFNESRSYVFDVAVTSGINNISKVITLESGTVDTPDNGSGLFIVIGAVNEGDFETGTTDSWIAGNFFTSTGGDSWATTNGLFVKTTKIKLEQGSYTTPYLKSRFADQLETCKRYFERIQPSGGANVAVASGYCESTTLVQSALLFSEKRVRPQIFSSATNSILIVKAGTNVVSTGVSFGLQSTKAASINANGPGLTAGEGVTLNFNTVNDYIDIDADYF